MHFSTSKSVNSFNAWSVNLLIWDKRSDVNSTFVGMIPASFMWYIKNDFLLWVFNPWMNGWLEIFNYKELITGARNLKGIHDLSGRPTVIQRLVLLSWTSKRNRRLLKQRESNHVTWNDGMEQLKTFPYKLKINTPNWCKQIM